MPSCFQPRLSVLQPPQRLLWDEFIDVPRSFVLCGGTAVALHLGHRTSVDFDFFGPEEFDPDTLYDQVHFLDSCKVIQKSANHLTCIVDRGGAVLVSFYGVPKLRPVEEPEIAPDNHLKIASLLDLSGMKAAVVQKRAEAKDYIDMDAILSHGVIDLPMALSAGRAIYGSSFNPENTLKSLSYYGDGNLPELSQDVRDRLASAVQGVELDRLPDLDHNRGRSPSDQERER